MRVALVLCRPAPFLSAQLTPAQVDRFPSAHLAPRRLRTPGLPCSLRPRPVRDISAPRGGPIIGRWISRIPDLIRPPLQPHSAPVSHPTPPECPPPECLICCSALPVAVDPTRLDLEHDGTQTQTVPTESTTCFGDALRSIPFSLTCATRNVVDTASGRGGRAAHYQILVSFIPIPTAPPPTLFR